MLTRIARCDKCDHHFKWDLALGEAPECPQCGHHPKGVYRDATFAELVVMMERNVPYISAGAAEELGNRGDLQAVPPLIAALERNYASFPAVVALGKLKDETAVDPLIAIATSDNSLSWVAIRSLVWIGSNRAIEAGLRELKESGIDRDMLFEILRSLLDTKRDDACDLLVPLLESPKWEVREGAAQALGRLSWQPSDENKQIGFFVLSRNWTRLEAMRDVALPWLVCELVKREASEFRWSLVDALDKLGWEPSDDKDVMEYIKAGGRCKATFERAGEAGVQALVAAIADTDAGFDSLAADMLRQMKNEKAVDALIPLLRHCDHEVRTRALDLLKWKGDSRAIDPLIGILVSSEGEARLFRWGVADALDKLGWEPSDDKHVMEYIKAGGRWLKTFQRAGEAGVQALVTAIADTGSGFHSLAADMLPRMKGEMAVDSLVPLLRHCNHDVRNRALNVLSKIGDSRAVDPLIETLVSSGGEAKHSAAEALGKLGDRRAVGPLIDLLSDADPSCRCIAASALGSLRDNLAVGPLLALLHDGDRNCRRSAIDALGEIGDDRAVEPLTAIVRCGRHANERDDFVYDAAFSAIERITGKPPAISRGWFRGILSKLLRLLLV